MTIIEKIPGHPRYSITDDAEVFGPRGHALKQTLIGGIPAISTSDPKCTIYLPHMASLIFFGRPPSDVEILDYLDGDPTNWRLENLAYKPATEWWWSRNPTALEVEYARLRRNTLELMRVPDWYRNNSKRDLGRGPDQ